jgi:hypothetical protein
MLLYDSRFAKSTITRNHSLFRLKQQFVEHTYLN